MERTTGISDINIYIPAPKLDLNTLIDERIKDDPRLERHLQRACRVTGQRAIRFPTPWEDTATLAASSAYGLIQSNPDLDVSHLRYLTVGTDSGVDHSKPVSAYVGGMLEQAGVTLPKSLSNYQVQHACAGGTLSLLSVSALLPRQSALYEGFLESLKALLCQAQVQRTADVGKMDVPQVQEMLRS